jgi:anti-anti-sigma regulatory factor
MSRVVPCGRADEAKSLFVSLQPRLKRIIKMYNYNLQFLSASPHAVKHLKENGFNTHITECIVPLK